jgi:hypothetical protein
MSTQIRIHFFSLPLFDAVQLFFDLPCVNLNLALPGEEALAVSKPRERNVGTARGSSQKHMP